MWKFLCVGFRDSLGCGKEFELNQPAGRCPFCQSIYVKRLDVYKEED